MQDWGFFWSQVLNQEAAPWVAFEHGTCILGAEIYAHHRLQHDPLSQDGDVIRHKGGYLYVTGGVSNWVPQVAGEERQEIVQRALAQRRADRDSRRVVRAERGAAAGQEERVARLLLKQARQDRVPAMRLHSHGEVSFLHGNDWVQVMKPPATVVNNLVRYFEQAAREREDLKMAWHQSPSGPWAELTFIP